jgi:hypothetical protein
MMEPGAKRRGRRRHARQFDPPIAKFLKGEAGPVDWQTPAFLDTLDAGLQADLGISIFASWDAAIWLSAAFGAAEFWFIGDVAEFTGTMCAHQTAILAKTLRARRFLQLLANSFESAAGEKAERGSSDCKGRFFRFVLFVIETSQCPLFWPCEERSEKLSLRTAINRALIGSRDASFEGTARFNALHAKHISLF